MTARPCPPILADLGLVTEGTVESWAVFSPDHRYRYLLGRMWAGDYFTDDRWEGCADTLALFTMLNPSTASAFVPDPTIKRCEGFAHRLHCGGFIVGNLFAWRATDPRELLRCEDPVGLVNSAALRWMLTAPWGGIPIGAWGTLKPKLRRRAGPSIAAAHARGPLWCFGKTKAGEPRHPLYLRTDTPLVNMQDGRVWDEPRAATAGTLPLPGVS